MFPPTLRLRIWSNLHKRRPFFQFLLLKLISIHSSNFCLDVTFFWEICWVVLGLTTNCYQSTMPQVSFIMIADYTCIIISLAPACPTKMEASWVQEEPCLSSSLMYSWWAQYYSVFVSNQCYRENPNVNHQQRVATGGPGNWGLNL